MEMIAFVTKCASLEETRNLIRELLKKKTKKKNRNLIESDLHLSLSRTYLFVLIFTHYW